MQVQKINAYSQYNSAKQNNNPNFQQMKIYSPKYWDKDILNAIKKIQNLPIGVTFVSAQSERSRVRVSPLLFFCFYKGRLGIPAQHKLFNCGVCNARN